MLLKHPIYHPSDKHLNKRSNSVNYVARSHIQNVVLSSMIGRM